MRLVAGRGAAEDLLAGRGAAAKVLNGREHCGRDLLGRSCWPGAARFVAGLGAVLDASGLYLNQLRGFCFVVPCQSSK